MVYEFDLIPDIYGLDWIGSRKWTHVQLCCCMHTLYGRGAAKRLT